MGRPGELGGGQWEKERRHWLTSASTLLQVLACCSRPTRERQQQPNRLQQPPYSHSGASSSSGRFRSTHPLLQVQQGSGAVQLSAVAAEGDAAEGKAGRSMDVQVRVGGRLGAERRCELRVRHVRRAGRLWAQ